MWYDFFMKYILDIEKAEKAVKDFYTATGVAVTIYDSTKEPVVASREYCSYCQYLRTGKNCETECHKSDITHINEAAVTQRQVKYVCHAGLMEVITPIFHERDIIAYMQIGQFCRDESSNTEEVALKYGLDTEKLKTLYRGVKRVSLKELDALLCICDIIIKYFWQEGIIYNNRSVLAVKIENYIERQIKERLYIDEIEKEFFANKSAMYSFFKKEFGCTPNDYIVEKRLNEAKRLLITQKNKNITEISAMCGFYDYNYFIRIFKSKTGKTPLKYRKENINKTSGQ